MSTTPTPTVTPNYLAEKNRHKRDKHVIFIEDGHYYLVKGQKFISVTTIIKPLCEEFNAITTVNNMFRGKKIYEPDNIYFGMSKQEIIDKWTNNGKEASELGTKLHYDIECVYNSIHQDTILPLLENVVSVPVPINNSIEFTYFQNFQKDFPDMVPYRTEWVVYYEKYGLAGSIDMTFIKEDGTILIYDWKRCKDVVPGHKNEDYPKFMKHEAIKHLPDTNYWHYVVQLNTYKYILEHKYGKVVSGLFLVVLHPINDNYIRLELPIITSEVKAILADYLKT